MNFLSCVSFMFLALLLSISTLVSDAGVKNVAIPFFLIFKACSRNLLLHATNARPATIMESYLSPQKTSNRQPQSLTA